VHRTRATATLFYWIDEGADPVAEMIDFGLCGDGGDS
jgi:hypothetical protein